MNRHFWEFITSQCVHQASLTDPVSSDQAVLLSVNKLNIGGVKESLSSNDEADVLQYQIVGLA